MSVLMVIYHYVDSKVPSELYQDLHALPKEKFVGQLEYLRSWHHPITPDEVFRCVREGQEFPPNRFMLTFDDGTKDHILTVAPILERHGLKGLFSVTGLPTERRKVPFVQKNQFVRAKLGQEHIAEFFVKKCRVLFPGYAAQEVIQKAPIGNYKIGSGTYLKYKYATNRLIPFDICQAVIDALFREYVSNDEEEFVDRIFLSKEEIRILRDMGHTIAAHTMSHRSLPALDESQQRWEIESSVQYLEYVLKDSIHWLGYPYGDFDKTSEKVAQDVGVVIAYGDGNGIWKNPINRLSAPRVDNVFIPTQRQTSMNEWSKELAKEN